MQLSTILTPLLLLFYPPHPDGSSYLVRQARNLSMTYFIHPDKATPCKDNFTDGLSSFLEQPGGYGDKAEVTQVSWILSLDLSVFDDVAYDTEDQKEVSRHWQDLDTFTMIVDTFIARIKRYPSYYKKVKYNPNVNKMAREMARAVQSSDSAGLWRQVQRRQKEPRFGYPPDEGYLREGRLLRDLLVLKGTLACYKQHGVIKVRLEYM